MARKRRADRAARLAMDRGRAPQGRHESGPVVRGRAVLRKHEHIVTAWAEHAAGPGWANLPLWLLIQDGDGKLRIDWLQPDEQSAAIVALFGVSARVAADMTNHVRAVLGRTRKAGGE